MVNKNLQKALVLFILSTMVLTTLSRGDLGLTVSIRTDPPSEPYPAATWIKFACDVWHDIGTVYHNWTFFCAHDSPPRPVQDPHTGYENLHGQITLGIMSTPRYCLDMVVCTARDSTGQAGSAVWRAGNITGVGFFGRKPIHNNSALVADSRGRIGTIYCHSSSFGQNIGRWISPTRRDITFNHNDNFDVRFNNGPYYPSYSTLALYNPLSTSFSTADQGAYSCVVPDSNGVMQTLSISIYPHGYQGELSINSVGSISTNPLTINCGTTGLPPTLAIWKRRGIKLSKGGTYQMTQRLKNRTTCDYDNMLTINQPINEAKGVYECEIRHAEYEPVDNNVTNVLIQKYNIGLYSLGSRVTVSCSFQSNATSYGNYDQNGHLLPNPFQLHANDSVHGKVFYCRGFSDPASTVVVKEIRLKVAIIVQDSVLAATASPLTNDNEPVLGQRYGMSCRAVKTSSSLINSPRPQWTDRNGSPVVEARGISLIESPGRVSLSISSLRTSHAGRYHCRATLTSPALDPPLIKVDTVNITLTIPAPTVTLTSQSTQDDTRHTDNAIELHCDATVSRLVDTPISVQFTWKDANTNRTITHGNGVDTVTRPNNEAHLYRSVLRLTELTSGERVLYCEAIVMPRSSLVQSHILQSSVVRTPAVSVNITARTCEEDFYIEFGDVDDCSSWTFEDTTAKIEDITTSLVEQINALCRDCQLHEQSIRNPIFSCAGLTSPNSVKFHTSISGTTNCDTTLVSITKWMQNGEATLTVQSNRLSVKPDCTRKDIPGKGCSIENSHDRLWLYVGIGAGGGALLLLVIVVFCVLCCVCKKKRSKQTEQPPDIEPYSYPVLCQVQAPMARRVNQNPPTPPPRPPQEVLSHFRAMRMLRPPEGDNIHNNSNQTPDNDRNATMQNIRPNDPQTERQISTDSTGYIDILPTSTGTTQSNKNIRDNRYSDYRYEEMQAVDQTKKKKHSYANIDVDNVVLSTN